MEKPKQQGLFKDVLSRVPPSLMLIIIFLASFAVYLNALPDGFVSDDKEQVVENNWIKHIEYIPDIFSKGVWEFQEEKSDYYRPMMHMIYMFNYHIFGLRPWGFHLVNVLFHSGVSILVFILSLKLLGQSWPPGPTSNTLPSFIAAMLFVAHPVHTEAVTWIAGLPDLSFTFFYLLSLYLYIRSAEGLRYGYLFSLVSFSCAILCKEPALTLPIILVAYDYLFRKEGDRYINRFKRYLPYIALAGFYLIVRISALGGFAPRKHYSYLSLNIYQYIINSLSLLIRYIEKLLFPVNLVFLPVIHPIRSFFETRGVLSLVLTAVLIVLAITASRKNRMAFFGILLFIVPLLPALYFVAIPNLFGERYLYLPSFGFVLLVSMLLARTANKPRLFVTTTAASLAVICLFSIGTVKRNAVWKDNLVLWSDTSRKYPGDYLAHMNVGSALLEKKRFDEAIEQLRIALSLRPGSYSSYEKLGNALFGVGRTDEAIEQFHIALKLKPDYPEAHYSLGAVYSAKGLTDKAIEQYRIAIKLKPFYARAYNNLGNDLIKKGSKGEALEQYKTAVELSPDLFEAQENLGATYYESGEIDAAIEHLRRAVQLKPEIAEAHLYLGDALYAKKLVYKAIEQYQAALRLKPDYADAHNNLGSAYADVGLVDKAIEHLERAVQLDPSNREFRNNVSKAYEIKSLAGTSDKTGNPAGR
jgi:tetratricopeptide (TPR) repeat protein